MVYCIFIFDCLNTNPNAGIHDDNFVIFMGIVLVVLMLAIGIAGLMALWKMGSDNIAEIKRMKEKKREDSDRDTPRRGR